MPMDAEQLRGALTAYQQVMTASWPDLLERDLRGYPLASSAPTCPVRAFWKLLPGFTFAGVNERFAHDAGMSSAELVGRDDFDRRLPWVFQAAKCRADDEPVVRSGRARLNSVERQRAATGSLTWVRVGKAPIRTSGGVIGVLGMYQVLDAETGHRAFAELTRRHPR